MSATRRWARSAANAGRRSASWRAHRNSLVALNQSSFGEALADGGDENGVPLRRAGRQVADNGWRRPLLRARRERPCDCRATEKGDELAPRNIDCHATHRPRMPRNRGTIARFKSVVRSESAHPPRAAATLLPGDERGPTLGAAAVLASRRSDDRGDCGRVAPGSGSFDYNILFHNPLMSRLGITDNVLQVVIAISSIFLVLFGKPAMLVQRDLSKTLARFQLLAAHGATPNFDSGET